MLIFVAISQIALGALLLILVFGVGERLLAYIRPNASEDWYGYTRIGVGMFGGFSALVAVFALIIHHANEVNGGVYGQRRIGNVFSQHYVQTFTPYDEAVIQTWLLLGAPWFLLIAGLAGYAIYRLVTRGVSAFLDARGA